MRSRIRFAVALALLLGSLPGASAEGSRRSAAELMDVLMWNREPVGGPFALTDHDGRLRTETDFRGRLLIVYFGYTHCPDVCPTDLMEIARALTILGSEGEAIQPLFVTLDPERDTPEHLREYLPNFHPRLIGALVAEGVWDGLAALVLLGALAYAVTLGLRSAPRGKP